MSFVKFCERAVVRCDQQTGSWRQVLEFALRDGILVDELDRSAVDATAVIKKLLGQLRANDLFLSDQRHVAGLRHRNADEHRIAGRA